ncbi:hypothetical protein EI94DRAFT_1785605 [Lactarius quietus]|nr:hypothetical protein EI94DRAFT_1785605 [Lactarius quietus]
MSSNLKRNICRALERRWKLPEDWQLQWPNHMFLRENAQSPSLGLKYNEQRVENSSLRPVLDKEGVQREKNNRINNKTFSPALEDTSVVDCQCHWQPEQVAIRSRAAEKHPFDTPFCETARARIAPVHPLIDKPGKGEVLQPRLDPRKGYTAIIGAKAHGARGLVPEHVHGSGFLSENARIPTQRGKALWDRKDKRGPRSDVKKLPSSTEKSRCGILSCHFLPPYNSGGPGGRQGKEAQELMVPVNGTRVGRAEERKRSEVP